LIALADVRVVIVEARFEESIGFVARAMKNFGLSKLDLVNPVANLGDVGRMRGGHAQEILDSIVKHDSLQKALDGVDLSVGTTAQTAFAFSNLLRKPMTPRELGHVCSHQIGKLALVFGREGTGLTNVELGQCDAIVTIPTAGDYETLNLSHAAAIIFYELFSPDEKGPGDVLATTDVKAAILRYFMESARLTGLEERKVGMLDRAFRNVLGRSAVRRREGSILTETLRRISETLAKSKGSGNPIDVHISQRLELEATS
jgi:tRNA/rRNA methyltransferase